MLDDVAAPLISDVKDTKKTKKGDGKDDKPPADEKSNRRPRAGKNDCKFCILDLCHSRRRGQKVRTQRSIAWSAASATGQRPSRTIRRMVHQARQQKRSSWL